MSIDTCDPRTNKEAAWAAFQSVYHGFVSLDLRRSVFEAANWRCCYCGVRMDETAPRSGDLHRRVRKRDKFKVATIEHIQRRADGGGNERGNLAASCAWCNWSRGEHDALVWFDQIQWLKERGEHPHFPDLCA